MSKTWAWIIAILAVGFATVGVIFFIKWRKEKEAKEVANETTAKVLTSSPSALTSPAGAPVLTPLATNTSTTAAAAEEVARMASYRVA